MKKLFIAEKASQCESLMDAFEPTSVKHKGYWEGENFIFTHAVGHLYKLKMHEFANDINKLPYVFDPTKVAYPGCYYEASENTLPQLKVVNKLLKRNDVSEIICATDPDAEGEAIYRTIVENVKVAKNINQSRLIIKDTTIEGLKKQYKIRKSIYEYEGLRQKAYARALTDYTLGINLSQAFTIQSKGKTTFSVGRVQTPVLKMIIDRYSANKNYVKKVTYGISFKINECIINEKNKKFNSLQEAKQYINSKIGHTIKFNITSNNIKSSPPSLYDLADIQKYGVDKLGISSNAVLKILQKLYEKKLVTYPRTDCKLITLDTSEVLNRFYGSQVIDSFQFNAKINPKAVGEVSAHEGLTLTAQKSDLTDLTENEISIYEEIKKRFLANYLDYAIARKVDAFSQDEETYFKGTFSTVLTKGYLELYNDKPFKNVLTMEQLEDINDELSKPIVLTTNNLIVREEINARPKLYTESTLITKMQNIHSEIEDNKLKRISKEIEGIGTPATRGAIIENLFKQNYVTKKGKSIIPTDKGLFLINELEKQGNPIINAEYTASLEIALNEVEENKNIEEYFNGLNQLTSIVVNSIKNSDIEYEEKKYGVCPRCKKGNIVKRKGKKGNFYPCTDETCEYTIPLYGIKFTEMDIEKMLSNKYSSTKSLKSKQGKIYKVKYKIVGDNLEREFVDKKKK